MMTGYYVLLALHLVIQVLLAYLLFRAIRRFRRVGGALSIRRYFTPIILSAVVLTYLLVFTAPYLLDLVNISNGTLDVSAATVYRVRGPLILLEDGRIMIYSPFAQVLEEGNHYQMTFLPRSQYIREFILLR